MSSAPHPSTSLTPSTTFPSPASSSLTSQSFAQKDRYNVVDENLITLDELNILYTLFISADSGGVNDNGINANWSPYETPSSFRYVQSIVHEDGLEKMGMQGTSRKYDKMNDNGMIKSTMNLPDLEPHLQPLKPLLEVLLQLADARREFYSRFSDDGGGGEGFRDGSEKGEDTKPEDAIIPLQWLLCYYADPSHSCPPHLHFCRQLTFDLGSDPRRVSSVWKESQEGESKRVDIRVKAGDISFLESEKHSAPALESSSRDRFDGDGSFGDGKRISINLFYTTLDDLRVGGVAINGNQKSETPGWVVQWIDIRNRAAGGGVLKNDVSNHDKDSEDVVPLSSLVEREDGGGGISASTTKEDSSHNKKRSRWKKGTDG